MFGTVSMLDWYLAVKRYFSTLDQLQALSDDDLEVLGLSRLDIHGVALDSFVKTISN